MKKSETRITKKGNRVDKHRRLVAPYKCKGCKKIFYITKQALENKATHFCQTCRPKYHEQRQWDKFIGKKIVSLHAKGLSETDLAKVLNTTPKIIRKALTYHRKRGEITPHTFGYKTINKAVVIPSELSEHLDGLLLGDGCLVLEKDAKNPRFCFGNKYKEYVDYVWKLLRIFNPKKPKPRKRKDKRKDWPAESLSYEFKTKRNPSLNPFYRRWYRKKDNKNIKKLPQDLKITPIVALHWHLGDGSFDKSTGWIHMATDCFSKKEQEAILISQLHRLGIKAKISPHEEKFRIQIPRDYVKKFLDYIGKSPIKALEYRWGISKKKKK